MVAETPSKLVEAVVAILQKILSEIVPKNPVVIGLSGGSMVQVLTDAFPKIETFDWSRAKFIFCDERIVPLDDSDSNFGAFKKNLIPAMAGKIAENQFLTIDPSLNPVDCAKDYEKRLLESSNVGSALPILDILLLGLGPDGHTCSLFPGHQLLKESSVSVAPIENSPKPPAERITLTIPAVNSAENVVFVTTGASKSAVIKEILTDTNSQLPGALVKPTSGSLFWIVDKAAVSEMDMENIQKMEL